MFVRGVAKYARSGVSQMSVSERAAATAKYAAAREKLAEYEQAMKAGLTRLNLDFMNRRMVMNFSRRLYRVHRLAYGPELFERIAAAAVQFVRKGLNSEVATPVVELSCAATGRGISEAELKQLKRVVRKQAGEEHRTMEREERMVEGRSQKSKIRMQSAEGETAKAAKSAKRIRRRKSPGGLGVSAVSVINDRSPLERILRQRAVEGFQNALAVHQPVVKACVARRLLDRLSYEELARELCLRKENVADILEKMRPEVAKFTRYFDDDWYWVEGGSVRVRPGGIIG